MEKITLKKPIKIGDKDVKEVSLREPSAGEMRGLKLTDVLQGDAATLITLLPRITTPAMSEAEVAALAPGAFAQLFGGLVGFFNVDEAETS